MLSLCVTIEMDLPCSVEFVTKKKKKKKPRSIWLANSSFKVNFVHLSSS